MAKAKEVTLRERMIGTVAESLMDKMDLGELPVTKEGLLLAEEGEQFVVKVIQKKKEVHQEDIKGLMTLGEFPTLENAGEGFDADEEEEEEAEELAEEAV